MVVGGEKSPELLVVERKLGSRTKPKTWLSSAMSPKASSPSLSSLSSSFEIGRGGGSFKAFLTVDLRAFSSSSI